MTVVGLLVAMLLKPAAVIVGAAAITAAMRHTSAAARHVVWSCAIGTALVLPLLTVTLPRFRVEAPVWLWSTERAAYSETQTRSVVPRDAPGAPSRTGSTSPSTTPATLPSASWPNGDAGAGVLILVWLVVAGLLVTRRIVAERTVLRIARDAAAAGRRTQLRAVRAARNQQLDTVPDVRVTDRVSSPAVVGIVRAVVLLNRDAEHWPDIDLDRVLVHELGHAARRDCLLNFCADIAAAIAWYNPLMRYAVRRMRLEAEQACDESVLRIGHDAEAYAHLLLRIAREDQVAGLVHGAATAMARVRQLEERIVALLEGNVRRAPLSRVMAGMLAVGSVALTIPVSTITLVAAELPVASETVPERDPRGNPYELLTEPDRLGDSLALPQSERIPEILPSPRAVTDALAGPDSGLARLLVTALDRAPEHDADLVSARAAWALSQVRDGRLVEPLIASLQADDWRVQSYAAWSLAPVRDSRAVPYLITMLDHRVWRARAMAAYALRETGDPRAISAMTAALSDRAWQVRVEAVGYLAAVGGGGVEPLLRARLADRHVAVRSAARRALTQP